MKTIGLVGGKGWVSALEYYRLINQITNNNLGGLNAAQCILSSFNYAAINELNLRNDHEGIYNLVLSVASKLKVAGVDCLVLCANTLHQYVERLEIETKLPIVHIADATAFEIKQ